MKYINVYRAKHGVPDLVWDEDQAKIAETAAKETCVQLREKGKPDHKGGRKTTNLYYGSCSQDNLSCMKTAIDSWYKENEVYFL